MDVVTLGETMALVSNTEAGPLRQGDLLRLSFAGAESNVAIGLARLGHRVGWVGRVGDDAFGRMILAGLRGEGVDVSKAQVDLETRTAVMVKERRTADAVRVGYYRRGFAGSRLSPADVDDAYVAGARVLHVTGITPALSETADAAVERAVELARRAGVLVSFDVNYRSALWSPDQAGARLRRLVPRVDLVFASLDETALLVGEQPGPEHTAKALAGLGPREVVVKLGSRGALAYVDGTVQRRPAVPVRAVDPVGAGDAFVAGYLAALLDGGDVADRLDLATRTGAFAVTVAGDWEGAPTRAELGLLGGDGLVQR